MAEAERVANTVAQGVHGRRRISAGETFWEYRHQRPEDPVSAIDWRQSAKSDHLYIRENEWEAAESIWLWRDASPSMTYQSEVGPCTKLDRATVLTLAIGSLLVRGGERIAKLGDPHPPSTGRAILRRVAMALVADPHNGPSLPPLEALPRFSQVVWVGDFLEPAAKTEEIIRFYASRGVKGHIMQVLDPAEEDLPFEGRTKFEGIEERINLTVGRAETLRHDYQQRMDWHQESLTCAAQRFGWTFAIHRTDRSAQSALLTLYAGLSGETLTGIGLSH
jgi:uncharacterized protein (DUF58 family)